MKHIKVLGSGCSKCSDTAKAIERVAAKKAVEISLEKVTSLDEIADYGVMITPAVVVDEHLVHAGPIPRPTTIESWLVT